MFKFSFSLLLDMIAVYLGKEMMFCFDISENPYKNFTDDDRVLELHKEYSGHWDKNAIDCGYPDKFVYEAVKEYLWYWKYNLAPVSIIIM